MRDFDVSKDGSLILTCSYDGSARVWDAGGRRAPGDNPGTVIGFEADGARYFTLTNELCAWTAWTRKAVGIQRVSAGSTQANNGGIVCDGARILTLDEEATSPYTNGRTAHFIRGIKGWLSFSPDGAHVAMTAPDWNADSATITANRVVRMFDADTLSEMSRCNLESALDDTFSAGIWETETGKRVLDLDQTCKSLCFSPDSTHIALASWSDVRVMDLSTGALSLRLRGLEGLNGCSYSPSGHQLVTFGAKQDARVWDAATGSPILVLRGHEGTLTDAVYSPDETRIATLSEDRTVRIWHSESGAELLALRDLPELHGGSLAFSPDGSRLYYSSFKGALEFDSVPRRVRADALARHESREAAGRKRVDELVNTCASLTEAVAQLRDDQSIDPIMKRVMLDIATQYAMQASQWVNELRDHLLFPDAVLACVRSDSTRPTLVRNQAEILAGALEDDPTHYNDAAWEIVRSPTCSSEQYLIALRASKIAATKRGEWAFVNTLGVAEYRAELYAESVKTLERSIVLSAMDVPDPADLAFIAMAQFRIGKTDEAQASLAQLREVMRNATNAADADNHAFLVEAESLISDEGLPPR